MRQASEEVVAVDRAKAQLGTQEEQLMRVPMVTVVEIYGLTAVVVKLKVK